MSNPRLRSMSRVICTFAAVAVMAFAATAAADLSENVLTVFASSPTAQGVFEVPYNPEGWDGDVYSWRADRDIPITPEAGGEPVGVIQEGTNISYQRPSDGRGLFDPFVNLNFAVSAEQEDTFFSITSALLSFDGIVNPVGRATAGITVTDGVDIDGATLSGELEGFSYQAQYNGFPVGTTFATLIPQVMAGPGGSQTESDSEPAAGFTPIAEPVSDISAEFAFTLSANDVASGTSLFVVIPEPASALLLVAALGLIRRR